MHSILNDFTLHHANRIGQADAEVSKVRGIYKFQEGICLWTCWKRHHNKNNKNNWHERREEEKHLHRSLLHANAHSDHASYPHMTATAARKRIQCRMTRTMMGSSLATQYRSMPLSFCFVGRKHGAYPFCFATSMSLRCPCLARVARIKHLSVSSARRNRYDGKPSQSRGIKWQQKSWNEPLRCKTQWDYGHQVGQQKPWNFPSLVGPQPARLVRQAFCEESSMSGTACLCKSRPMSPNTAPAAKSGQPRSRKTAVTSYDHQILPPSRQVLSLPSFTWLLLYYFFLYLSFLTLPLYWQFHYCPFLYLATTLLFLSLLVCSFAVLFLDCSLAVLSKSAHRKFFN